MNNCCSKCQATSKKKIKKLREESDEETVTQMKENSKTDETSDQKDNNKKKKNILTWSHTSTKKEKGHGNNLLSETNSFKPPGYTARSMMHHGGHNPLNRWLISTAPRGHHHPPMFGPNGYGGGPFQPHQTMTQATMYKGANISPYPPMAAAFPPHYWQTRPFIDTNPMTRYTSYADNFSYCFI